MGEAKRRKQIDPNYGKVKRNLSEFWCRQMFNDLPRNFKLDGGHILYSVYGDQSINIIPIGKILATANDPKGKMIQISTPDSILSIIMSNQQFEYLDFKKYPWLNRLPQLVCVPMLDERYQASSGEWVLPYQVKDIQYEN